MSSVVVVDDTLLTLHLAGRDGWLPVGATVATTASWWFRLTRALERDTGGALSGLVSQLRAEDHRLVTSLVRRLPDDVTVLHPRDTVPQAAALSAQHGLNLLTAEAVATALVLKGRILVDVHDVGPRLRSAALDLGIGFDVVEP